MAGEHQAASGADFGFQTYVGPVQDLGDGVFELAIEPRHMNGNERLHGGMTMSLAAIVLGTVAKEAAEGASVLPMSLNCDFLAAGMLNEAVTARAKVTRRTRSVVFLSGDLMVGDRVLLTATGVYRIEREEQAA